ncbi:MAG: hypothetical protein ABSF26_07145 [Thermoguttaceae bacterium]|jgi:hypothetical protein
MPETNQNSNTTEAAPAVANQAPIVQMSATDLQDAVKAIIAQMAPAAQSGPVVVQVSADDLKKAVCDTIVEMRQHAVTSSKSAIVGLLTLPVKATSDWLHWRRYGDVGGSRGFSKPKVWPAPGETAEQAFVRVYGEPQQA